MIGGLGAVMILIVMIEVMMMMIMVCRVTGINLTKATCCLPPHPSLYFSLSLSLSLSLSKHIVKEHISISGLEAQTLQHLNVLHAHKGRSAS